MNNYWEISGEVIKIREHVSYDFGATLTVRSVAQRAGCETTSIVEMQVIVPERLWKELFGKGCKLYSLVKFEGHFETMVLGSDTNIKLKLKHFVDKGELIKP